MLSLDEIFYFFLGLGSQRIFFCCVLQFIKFHLLKKKKVEFLVMRQKNMEEVKKTVTAFLILKLFFQHEKSEATS